MNNINKKRIKRVILSIILSLGILITIYFGYKNDIFVKEGINLVCSDNTISWSFKDGMDLEEGYFILYRDGKELYKGDKIEHVNSSLEDTEKPESIENINISYERHKIILDWDISLDKGSDNKFKIYFVNKYGIKILKSNENIYNYSSGISKYIINIGKSTFETNNNRLAVDREELDLGVLDTSIIALDNSNNDSIPLESESIRNFSLSLVDEGEKFTIINDDKEQDYTYKVYINDREIELNDNSINYKDMFEDVKPSEMPDAWFQMEHDNNLSFNWIPFGLNKTTYKYHVEGLGASINRAFSKEFIKVSHLKGYYYKVNGDESYSITDKDTFIDIEKDESTVLLLDLKDKKVSNFQDELRDVKQIVYMDMDLDEEPYYFHIASIDSVSNASETFSYKFTVTSKEKLKMVESFFVKGGNMEDFKYDIERRYFAKLPDNIIGFMEAHNLKIYFTDDDLNYMYKKETGIESEFYFVGLFLGEFNEIFLSNNSVESFVLHEVGHSIDYIASDYYNFSFREDFVDIYYKEKDELYSNYDYPRTEPKEYFAEAFSDYFKTPDTLKKLAPLTYDYMEELVKGVE